MGEHDGYMRLAEPVLHQRHLDLDKETHTLKISDNFLVSAPHTIRLYFQLNPTCTITHLSANEVKISNKNSTIYFRSAASRVTLTRATSDSEIAWVSRGYHTKQASTCIIAEQTIDTDTTIKSIISLEPSNL